MATKPSASLIAGKTLKEIIWNPVVYVPYTAVAVSNALLPFPAWMNIPAVMAITAGHIWYWRRNWNFLYQKHELAEEIRYRKDQNIELRELLAGKPLTPLTESYAPAVASALDAKAEIERKVFSDEIVTERERDLLETVEATVRQMIQILATAKTKEPPAEYGEARDTLLELNQNFQHVTRPVFPTDEENQTNLKSGLAESTKALKNRMEEASRIRSIATETREKTR